MKDKVHPNEQGPLHVPTSEFSWGRPTRPRAEYNPDMKTVLRTAALCSSLAIVILWTSLVARAQQSASRGAVLRPEPPRVRELDWDTYLDKVQGAWLGKMIGVTFGQPWEFNYQGTPIGFDIDDWTLSPTRMKDYRTRAENERDYQNPITREADSKRVHINKGFVEASEKEHTSFGVPDNDDIYINILFLYCLRRYGIDVDPVTVAHAIERALALCRNPSARAANRAAAQLFAAERVAGTVAELVRRAIDKYLQERAKELK